jgi:hypothetical protein
MSMTSSNVYACSNGRSAGLTPFTVLETAYTTVVAGSQSADLDSVLVPGISVRGFAASYTGWSRGGETCDSLLFLIAETLGRDHRAASQ